MKLKILIILFLIFPILNIQAEISLKQVMKNPSNLKLNLQYAKEQEDLGNYKSVIATLERLTSLYPENIDLKLYYLTISIRIDSTDRTLQLIREIKDSKEITNEINAEIEIILANLNNEKTKEKSKWNRYLDFSVTNTTNTNINNISETGQFYVSDSISNYASNEVKKDNLTSSSIKIGASRMINDNSKLNFNFGFTQTNQEKDNTNINSLDSISINYGYVLNRNYISSTISYNHNDYKYQADTEAFKLNIKNRFQINNKNYLRAGITYGKTNFNQTATYSTTREKNNEQKGLDFGYDFYLDPKNIFQLNYKINDFDAVADQYGFEQNQISLSYTRALSFGNITLSSSQTKNKYDRDDTFVRTGVIRDDTITNNTISLNGNLFSIAPLNKIDFFENLFYFVTFSRVNSNSNLINYEYDKEIFTIGLTKRLEF